MPLRNHSAISFLATANAALSKEFFQKTAGLDLIEETDFALVFSTGNGQLRIQKVQEVSSPAYTSMGWQVDDIQQVVAELTERGAIFDRFDGLTQGDTGIWISPSGAKIAWFRDPDGNTLSLTQN